MDFTLRATGLPFSSVYGSNVIFDLQIASGAISEGAIVLSALQSVTLPSAATVNDKVVLPALGRNDEGRTKGMTGVQAPPEYAN